MAGKSQKLDELAALLERTGGDSQRIDVVRRTQQFRRSWIELAEALCKIRRSGRFRKWGYEDFYLYCSKELTLKRATVDKLTMSYSALRIHVPEVLKRDGVAKQIPSIQAIDYFTRAVGQSEDTANNSSKSSRNQSERSPKSVDDLARAIFSEDLPVREIRRKFDPVFYPESRAFNPRDVVVKANSLARKLVELIEQIEDIDRDHRSSYKTYRTMLHKLCASLNDLKPSQKSENPTSPPPRRKKKQKNRETVAS